VRSGIWVEKTIGHQDDEVEESSEAGVRHRQGWMAEAPPHQPPLKMIRRAVSASMPETVVVILGSPAMRGSISASRTYDPAGGCDDGQEGVDQTDAAARYSTWLTRARSSKGRC